MVDTEKPCKYEVVFDGEVLPGFTAQTARENMAKSFLLSPLMAASVKFDGSTIVLYMSNSKRMAFEAHRKFLDTGLNCRVRKRDGKPAVLHTGVFGTILNYALIMFAILLALLAFSFFLAN